MSEHITHIAVYEDVARIFLNDPEICEAFKTCVTHQYDSGLLGSGSRGNHIFALPILDEFKDKWESVKDDNEAQTKMAYAIGWLMHRAADRRLKLVFAEAENDPNPAFTNDGCRIYHDAMTFRNVYDGGRKPCLSTYEKLSPATFDYNMQSHPGAQALNVSKMEPLLNRMWQTDLVRTHTFLQNETDFDTWVDTFVEVFPDLSEDLRKYEKAYNDPDPVLAARYYEQDNFYDETDEIIQYVRAYQNGAVPEAKLSDVVEKAKSQSLYSQSLRQGYFYIKGASDYFVGKIDKNALEKILEKRIS